MYFWLLSDSSMDIAEEKLVTGFMRSSHDFIKSSFIAASFRMYLRFPNAPKVTYSQKRRKFLITW